VPLQTPIVPQVEAAVMVQPPAGSGVPAASGAQVPAVPGSAQELQAPQEAAPQHTPLTQWVLMQSPPVAQARPFGLSAVQEPERQTFPAAHWASVEQVVRQEEAPQTYGVQVDVLAVAQAPVPVQCDSAVYVPAAQDSAPQVADAGV